MTGATVLRIPQGKSWAVAFPVLNDNFDPAGWTVRSEIRERTHSALPVHTWPSTGASAVFEQVPADDLRAAGYPVPDIDPMVLCVVLRLTPDVSAAWADTWSTGVFDVEAVSGDGEKVARVASGTVIVQREITRAS